MKKDGNYYLSSLAGGLTGDAYAVVIDNGAAQGKSGGSQASIKLSKGGWESASLTRSMFQLDAYNERIARIKTQPASPDVAAKLESLNNPEQTRKDDPLYAYNKYYVGSTTSSCTFRRSISFTSGNTYTFETKQPSGATAIDTVMYLSKYNSDGYPGGSAYSFVDDDGGSGTYSKITASISSTGTYYVVVRSYAGTSTTGVADIYKDGSLWQSDIEVGGYKVYVNTTNGNWRNYCVANKTTSVYNYDSYAWTTYGTSTDSAYIIKFNDDSIDEADYNRGYMSRIRTGWGVRNFFVANYSPSTSGSIWRLYMLARDTYTGEQDPVDSFENLEPIDRIRPGAETGGSWVPGSYNCISWSGGITSYWVWPLSSGSP